MRAAVLRQGDAVVELGQGPGKPGIPEDLRARPEDFEMKPVLITPIEEMQVCLERQFAGVTAVREELRQITSGGAVAVFDRSTELDSIMRNLLELDFQRVCFVIEPSAGL